MVTVADTAFSIAAVRAEERALPEAERLFEDPYASLFHEAGAHAAEATARYLELPYFREGIRLRTRGIDDAVREGFRAGLGQLVILGTGFDMRALRLSEVAANDVSVFEIDVAEQLDRKRAVLTAAGVALPASVRYVPFDFEQPFGLLTDAMVERGFRRGGGAMFIWEGVIGYIDLAAIDRSLRFMADAGGEGSRLVFSFADTPFEPGRAADHVHAAGFSTFEEVTFAELWTRYRLAGPASEAMSFPKLGMASVRRG